MKNKKSKSSIFGFCSAGIAAYLDEGIPLNYESSAIIERAKEEFDEVVLINPFKVYYRFERKNKKPCIIMNGKDISNISSLLVRGTKGCEQSISVLVQALKICGCFIFDLNNRFSGESASKLSSTIDRYEHSVGTDSYYAFSSDQAIELVEHLSSTNSFPLLSKPIHGKQGRDVVVFSSSKEAITYIHDFYSEQKVKDTPILIQPYMDFIQEFRAIVVGKKILGLVQKNKSAEQITANAETGATFSVAADKEINKFIKKNIAPDEISGIDIARDNNNQLHIIETNAAPLWEEFERATGVDVAKEIIKYAKKR